MALYMLDTDTVMYLIRGKTPALDERIAEAVPAQLCVSAITRGELLCGLSRQMLQGKRGAGPAAAALEETPLNILLEKWPYAVSMDEAPEQLLRRTTQSVLAQLTPSKAKELRRQFGLDRKSPRTLEEVGEMFDMTRERLRQGTLHRWSQVVDQFLARVQCLPWDEAAATHFAAVAAELHRAGADEPLGSMDMMIAGHAIATGAVLVTTHVRELGRVSGLTVENWTWGDRSPVG